VGLIGTGWGKKGYAGGGSGWENMSCDGGEEWKGRDLMGGASAEQRNEG